MIGEYDYNNLPEEIINKISNGLLFINEKGEYISAIASSWEVTNEGKEYRFHIRDGLIWSNGKKFTAEDINYNFMDIKTKVIDEKTIYFILKSPLPIFPTFLKRGWASALFKRLALFYLTRTPVTHRMCNWA